MNHTEISLDPNEQTSLRYRLFSRAIKINGLAQMNTLYPYLQARLEQSFERNVDLKSIENDSGQFFLRCDTFNAKVSL